MSTRSASHEVTRLLDSNGATDATARSIELLPLVYDQLRRMALRQLRGESADHSLQPTALINELYLLLVRQRGATGHDRAHFLAIAAQMMRRILVDHARSRLAAKRGSGVMTVAVEQRPRVRRRVSPSNASRCSPSTARSPGSPPSTPARRTSSSSASSRDSPSKKRLRC